MRAVLVVASISVALPAMAHPTYRLQGPDLVAANVTPAQLLPVAVLDFRAVGGPEQRVAEAVAENLRNALVQHQQFTVIERTQIQQVLKEQSFTQTGLADSAQAAAVGRLLGARLVVVGSVTQLGGTYTINARFIDVATGQVTEARSLKTDREADLAGVVDALALALGGKAPAERVPTGKSRLVASGLSLMIPGVGQFYGGNGGWGLAHLALNVVGIGVTLLGQQQQNQAVYGVGMTTMGLASVWSGVDAWLSTAEKVPEH
jgi:TolB-like protein